MTEAFCEEIANAGYLPVVYSYASFFNSYLDMTALSKYPVWVAHVDTDKPHTAEHILCGSIRGRAVSAESTAMLIWITATLTLMRIQGSSAEWEEVSSANGYKSIGGSVTLPSRRSILLYITA